MKRGPEPKEQKHKLGESIQWNESAQNIRARGGGGSVHALVNITQL